MSNNWFVDEESRHRWIWYRVRRHTLSTRTAFQDVDILESHSQGTLLVIDGKIQSAEFDEYVYHEALVHPVMVAHPDPRRVLILGGGEGAALREVLKHGCVRRAVMVDLDEELVQLCKKHLKKWHCGAFDDRRARLIFDDATKFVRASKDTFDVIIADISDPQANNPATGCYTREFYGALKKRLAPGGIFVTQATEIFLDGSGIYSVLYNTARSVFGSTESYGEFIPSFTSLWGFVAASPTLSLRSLDAGTIAARLRERKVRTAFYTPQTHARMLILPPGAEKKIAREKRLSTKKNPAVDYSSR
ncbi:MAG: polyamine aminopropyltransferase [Pseudomonadota bacterium]